MKSPCAVPLAVFSAACAMGAVACSSEQSEPLSRGSPRASGREPSRASAGAPSETAAASPGLRLPLVPVADVPLPGRANRFDYQDLDAAKGLLVIAHMNDASVVVVKASDGSVVKVIPNVPRARGVAIAAEVGRIFVTSSPHALVVLDEGTLDEIARVETGAGPDGVGWDPTHEIVGVSDQHAGAISLLAGAGRGARRDVPLGRETGNVVFDAPRGVFWITVVGPTSPDALVSIDPVAAKKVTSIPLPGCAGAHGLRIHPDGKSALVACEDDAKLARVELDGAHAIELAPTGDGPDVLAIDPGLGWIYVAAESGDLTVFDLGQPGLARVGAQRPGERSHSVAVDPATHRVFFPLEKGPNGAPVLRIMKPTGA
jgi:DNA-binding beta-propeller fold protein YncE